MAKNSVEDWSTTAANNTDIGGTNIGEHCALSGINNAIRKVMAQTKQKFDDVHSSTQETLNGIQAQVNINAENSAPATTEKIGTVKLVDEINDTTDDYDAAVHTVATPKAVADYVRNSSDYGTLDDEELESGPSAETPQMVEEEEGEL